MAPARIVIVEDDDNVAQLLGFLLRREGHEPLILRDGREAEEYVAAHEPAQAVILDVMLPYRDGLEVAASIRADGRWGQVPIVLLTARSPDAEQLRALGVAGCLVKPFHPRELLDRVRELIGRAGP